MLDSLRAVERWGDSRGWTGSDPYDGLNARRFDGLLRRTPFGRRVLTQVVRRSPVDLRRVLGVPPGRSAAALASVASAYALGADVEKLQRALALLEELRCRAFDEPCWGYHFDVQTRVFFYPRGAPNTIATSFAGLALVDAFELTGDAALLERASGVTRFFLRHVPQTPAEGGAFFGYLVGDRTPIHNSNLLVCWLLARVHAHTGDAALREAAEAGVAYTVHHQRDDGSWPYAERPGLRWVDGYHTGYVLDALLACREAGIASATAEAVDRGLDHYRTSLFLADGTPKYTTTSVHPIDIQCVAQGIQTFALASRTRPELLVHARRVFEVGRRLMQRPDGAFAYQRERWWTVATPHVRWAAAPMLLALTHLARALHETP
ncbi:MAG: hypothetical protein ACJ744_15875 [Gaiellaceae bacterium]